MSGIGLETVNAMAQGLKLGGKSGDLSLELKDSLSGRGIGSSCLGPIVLRARQVRRRAEEMCIAGLARARLTR